MRVSLFLAGAMLFTGLTAHATTITQFTSSAQLNPSDTAFIDPDPVGTIYSGPSVSFNTTGGQLTFSRGAGSYEADQVGVTYGNSAFANGTKTLGAGGFQGPGSGGPVTLTFGTAVTQFGLNIEEFNSGPYTVAFTAFNRTGTNLGTFLASGSDPAAGGPGVLSFESLSVSGDSIAKVVFNDSAAGGSNNLSFGNVDFGQNAPAAVTPEPSSFLLLGTGLLGALGAARKRFA